MAFLLARMSLDSPEQWTEQMGDPVTNIGGAPVPAVRSALRHSVDVPTFTSPIGEDTPERRLRLRRQIRSLLNNTQYKMLGVFLVWEEDTEQNGWYLPDQGQLAAGADSPLTHGYFKLENFVWYKVGAPRTHRAAAGLSIKDLRTGQVGRDILRRVYSSDFSTLEGLPITYLHAGAIDVINSVLGSTVATIAQPAGRDGGANLLALEQSDLEVISYELPEASRNQGDVVIYDTHSKTGLPVKGEDPQTFGWEEIYGPDYPVTSGSVPVLDNGFVRVVFDTSNVLGFRVFTWNGTEYIEQGKMIPSSNTVTATKTLVSASIKEYTPERAVVQAIFLPTNSPREAVYITLQRGWRGPRFESYSPVRAGGEQREMKWTWFGGLEENTSILELGSTTSIAATAGTGSQDLPGERLTATFTKENEVITLRQGQAGSMQLTLAVVQAAIAVWIGPSEDAYGVPSNAVELITEEGNEYISVQLGFAEQHADQIMEAETMTLSSGSTVVTDANASNGKAVENTRTTQGAAVTKATWPNSYAATFGIAVRARIEGATLNLEAGEGGFVTTTQQITSATYVWVYLDSLLANGGGTFTLNAWGTEVVGTFPTLTVTDTLKRAAEKPLSDGSKWSAITGATDTGEIAAGEAWQTDAFATISGARWNVAEQSNPAVSLEILTAGFSHERYIGVWACLAAAAKSGYFVRWEEEATSGKFKVTIEKWAAAVKTVLATFTEVSMVAGDSIGISVRNEYVTAWHKTGGAWVVVGKTKDTTYTKGYSGMEGSGTGGKYRNFSTGEIAAGTPHYFIDRIEAYLLEDRSHIYAGGQDLGHAVLIDSRVTPTVVTRS